MATTKLIIAITINNNNHDKMMILLKGHYGSVIKGTEW